MYRLSVPLEYRTVPKKKSVPSYRYHKARDCAVVTINGRNHYLGPFNSPASKEKYARLIAELAGQSPVANVASARSGGNITITELCAAYLDWAATYYSKNGRPTSQLAVIRMTLRSLRRIYGSVEARVFGP